MRRATPAREQPCAHGVCPTIAGMPEFSGLEPAATGGSSVAGVIGKDDTGRRWSIGELARASGLTVRALRHYDEIGLLTAGERTASGHRRYTERDLRRLYRVRALRTLGLSLEEIAGVLADPADDLTAMGELLAAQLRGLEAQAERIERLTHQVRGLLRSDRERVDARSGPVHDDLGDDLGVRDLIHAGAAGASGRAQGRARARRRRGGQDRMGRARRGAPGARTGRHSPRRPAGAGSGPALGRAGEPVPRAATTRP